MIIGQTIFSDDTEGVEYFTPWFPRGGNLACFVADMIQVSNKASSLTITVETKNSEDSDKLAAAVGSAATITLTAGTQTSFTRGGQLSDTVNDGFRDLVRFKIVLKSSTANALAAVHLRMLNPSWLSN